MEMAHLDDDTDDDVVPESEKTPLKKKQRVAGIHKGAYGPISV